jgi:hypothetical protein
MGGKLFNRGRIDRDRYLDIEADIRNYLDRSLGSDRYRIPRYYGNKPDFGDLDILIRLDPNDNWQQMRQSIVTDLDIVEFKSAGSVFSTLHRDFQVDYFTARLPYFESTYNYLSFNDLGNLIGKICRRFNLKYGERGLSYVYRYQNSNFQQEIELTHDFAAICQLLELDYSKWQAGFADLNEVFEWTIACPYFSVAPYIDRSTSLERRVKERSTIQSFLDYLDRHQITKTYQYLDDRDDYLPWIAANFPAANLLDRIATAKAAAERSELVKSKFNGETIMRLLPHLAGKELGHFIVNFKQQFTDFEEFVIATEPHEIERSILEFAQSEKWKSDDRANNSQ